MVLTQEETVRHACRAHGAAVAEEKPLLRSVETDRWADEARLLAVVAHPMRLAILEILCEKPRCVKHINALVPLAQSHLSQHLGALRKARLVASLACGPLRCYYVLQPTLAEGLIALLRQEHPVQRRDCQSMGLTSGESNESGETDRAA